MRLALALVLTALLSFLVGCRRSGVPARAPAGPPTNSPKEKAPQTGEKAPAFDPDNPERSARWLEELSKEARYPTGNLGTDRANTDKVRKVVDELKDKKVRWPLRLAAIVLPGEVRLETVYAAQPNIMPRPGARLCGLRVGTMSGTTRASLLPVPDANWLSAARVGALVTVEGTIADTHFARVDDAWEFLFVLERTRISP